MRNVANIYSEAAREGRKPISFEVFPPKGDLTLEAAREMAGHLAQVHPNFISVTYSAGGGGNKQATAAIASMIQNDFAVPTVAHLTCAGMTEADYAHAVAELRELGVHNVLALRGDLSEGEGERDADAAGSAAATVATTLAAPFTHAYNLCECLVADGFCVGGAAYPEGHVTCFDDAANIAHLKQKQDAGASFFITQLFFDNDCFYRFREAAQTAGITTPISCGIMPFLSKAQIQRMVFLCGASLPAPIIKLLARWEHDPASLRQAGIEYACNQLVELAKHGVDGLHVYTMNHPDIARAAVFALRESGQV